MAFGSLFNHLTTIIFLSVITYIVLDVNHFGYERSDTNKFMIRIGAAPYVNHALNSINNNKIYQQHILPGFRKFIHNIRHYTQKIGKNLSLNLDKPAKFAKKCTLAFVEFVDKIVLPKLVDLKNFAAKSFQKFSLFYKMAEEAMLNFIATLEKNEFFYKTHDFVTNFLLSVRKQAFSAVEWILKNVQQIMS